MSENDIKGKRKRFCTLYVVLGDAEEAAIKAGFEKEKALDEAVACLRSSACRRSISELRKALGDGGSVISGLRRLAFGSCNDAVLLALSEDVPSADMLGSLDLFNVSEIKRIKGGSVEVKLFDRMKALEKLYELENAFDDRGRSTGLIEALTASAREEGDLDDK